MLTSPGSTGVSAAEAAAAEAAEWAAVAGACTPTGLADVWRDVPPTEAAVVWYHDPREDLEQRGADWGFVFGAGDLADLARFAAGLARIEAGAWTDGDATVAARAHSDRRFLVGDRIVHWAVPWLDTVGRCYPGHRDLAHATRDRVLRVAERFRPAPRFAAGEGLHPPGQDSYGPVRLEALLAEHLASLWSGAVVMDATVRSIGGTGRVDIGAILSDPVTRDALRTYFDVLTHRWSRTAEQWAGTAALWSDLSARAARTAAAIAGRSNSPAP